MKISQINDDLNTTIKKVNNKIVNKSEITKKITEVIKFTEQQVKTFIENSMQEEFEKFYGTNFSSDVLRQSYSVSFINLRPDISYTLESINQFKFNLDIQNLLDDMDDFIIDMNDMENEEEYYDEELYNEYFGDIDNIEEESDFQSKKKINLRHTYCNKMFRQGQVPIAEEAFKKAKENVLEYYNSIEKPKLKAYSKKKLGIDIF